MNDLGQYQFYGGGTAILKFENAVIQNFANPTDSIENIILCYRLLESIHFFKLLTRHLQWVDHGRAQFSVFTRER